MADPEFEMLLEQFLNSDRNWFAIQQNRTAMLEHLVATGKMVREIVEGELWYRSLEAEEKQVVLKNDYAIARAGKQLKEQYSRKKKIAAVPPSAAEVVKVNFRRLALDRKLRGASSDNEKGLVLCDWLIAAGLSAREQEFVESLQGQILGKPDFALSEKQAKWLRDIWVRVARKVGG
jgi:hypothetical protein